MWRGLVASKSNRDYIAAEELRCELSKSMEFLKTPDSGASDSTFENVFLRQTEIRCQRPGPGYHPGTRFGQGFDDGLDEPGLARENDCTGKTHFWSRSRQKFWMKGESSGHTQAVKNIALDCDGDTLLIQVEQIGAACHEGYRSCFFRSVTEKWL